MGQGHEALALARRRDVRQYVRQQHEARIKAETEKVWINHESMHIHVGHRL